MNIQYICKTRSEDPFNMYVYLSVENIVENIIASFRAIMVYVFHFGHIIYRKVHLV